MCPDELFETVWRCLKCHKKGAVYLPFDTEYEALCDAVRQVHGHFSTTCDPAKGELKISWPAADPYIRALKN